MELKWLEDLIAVAESGNFSRAAAARHVTQSAFSRRIQSLEFWVGAELLDRSQQPVSLTPEGEDFILVARDIVARSHDAKRKAMANARIADTGVRVACLHTLALYFLPQLCADLRRRVGPFEVSSVAETRTVEEYLAGLLNGGSDFFISYDHPSVSFDIDPDEFPSMEIGIDAMVPVGAGGVALTAADLAQMAAAGTAIPYLEYANTSYMSHVVDSMMAAVPTPLTLAPVYRASLAESLFTAARCGLGMGWVPQSILCAHGAAPTPPPPDWSTRMTIRIYRAARNNIRTVEAIWSALAEGA